MPEIGTPVPGDGVPGSWYEVVVPAPAESHSALLVHHIRPVLATMNRQGLTTGAAFLRPLPGAQPHLTVQLRTADAGTEPLAGGLRELGHRCGVPMLTARPAQLVPLAGGGFAGTGFAGVARGFLADTTPTLLGLVSDDPTGRAALLGNALELMIGHLRAVGTSTPPGQAPGPDLGRAPVSFLSYRSHAEAFVATSRDPVRTRRALDERYEAVEATVTRRVATILDHPADAATELTEAASAWCHAVRTAKPEMTAGFRNGSLVVLSVPGTGQPDPTSPLAGSSFHTTVVSSAHLQRYLHGDPGFLAVRLLTSLLYLSLHNIGVSQLERYFLCHAVSRACESVFGVDAVTVLARMAS